MVVNMWYHIAGIFIMGFAIYLYIQYLLEVENVYVECMTLHHHTMTKFEYSPTTGLVVTVQLDINNGGGETYYPSYVSKAVVKRLNRHQNFPIIIKD